MLYCFVLNRKRVIDLKNTENFYKGIGNEHLEYIIQKELCNTLHGLVEFQGAKTDFKVWLNIS